jgi:hypothetical protein
MSAGDQGTEAPGYPSEDAWGAVLPLIAVAAFVSTFVLTSVFAVRPSVGGGSPPPPEFPSRTTRRRASTDWKDTTGQALARAEWSSRLQRELRKLR